MKRIETNVKENIVDVAKNLILESKKVAGLAVHSYMGSHSINLNLVRAKYPDMLIFQTEGCCSFSSYEDTSWINDAEYYILNLMLDINHGINGFIDWNIF